MAKLGTDCNGCCFFDEDKKDCKNNLLSIFKDRGASIIKTSNAPHFDRICQYRRNSDWNVDKPEQEKMKIIQDEIYVKGTIILIAQHKDELVSTINKLNINTNISNFKFVILFKDMSYSEVYNICSSSLKSKYQLITMVDNDINYQIYKSLKFAKHGFLLILECNKDFDGQAIDKLNNFVNKKMFRTLYIRGINGIHQSVAMAHLYKFLKGDNVLDYEQKLLEISKEENSDPQIFNWEDVNEQYCH